MSETKEVVASGAYDPDKPGFVNSKGAVVRVPKDNWWVGLATPEGVSANWFRTLLNNSYMHYISTGESPTVDSLYGLTNGKFTKGKLAKIMATKEFKNGLKFRGIPVNDTIGLTAEQGYVLSLLTDVTDRRPVGAKLKQCGVSYAKYRAWLKQPAFSSYMQNVTENALTEHAGDINTVLVNKALNGDLNSIKYVHELSGRHDPNHQQLQDLRVVMDTIIESIMRHVKDTSTIQAINADINLALHGKTPTRAKQIGR